ncbi:MAG: beta strand repeat-containing protein [Gemmataceae bacterium]
MALLTLRKRLPSRSVKCGHFRRWVERCEERIVPAAASFSAGTLTINYTATGTTVESVTVSNNGTNITLTGVTGTTSVATSTVTTILQTNGGTSSNQSITFAGTAAFSLSGGVTVNNVDVLTVNNPVNATGTGVIGFYASRSVVVNAGVSSVDGNITLSGNSAGASTGTFIGVEINAATVQVSGNGDLNVTGVGGTAVAGAQYGVHVHAAGVLQGSNSGSVNITGTGGSNAGNNNYGVFVTDVNSKIMAGGPIMQVIGNGGGTGSASACYGVFTTASGKITGENLTITGKGVGSSSGKNNHGAYLSGGTWSANSFLSIFGTEGAATTSVGILADSGTISCTNGGMNIVADTTNISNITVTAPFGIVNLLQRTSGRPIYVGSADSYGVNLGLSDAELDLVSAFKVQIGSSSTGEIQINSAITHANSLSFTNNSSITINQSITLSPSKNLDFSSVNTINLASLNSDLTASGTGSISLTTQKNIWLQSNSSIVTASGAISLSANQQATATTGTFSGILLDAASISSTSGNVTLNGRGGNTSTSNYGVSMTNAATVSGGGAGTTTTVNGTGGASTSTYSKGVAITTFSSITSAGGAVGVTGNGGAGPSADGVYLLSSSKITAGGTGNVTVNGTAGATGGTGLWVGTTITSNGGNVSVTGTGGGSGSGVSVGGMIAAGGSGSVSVNGTGGTGNSVWEFGVSVTNSSAIKSAGGNVSVVGHAVGTGAWNHGVDLESGGLITAALSGTVTVSGTGAPGGNTSYGVNVNNATISSAGGKVTVSGTGGGSSFASSGFGVGVLSDGVITAGGTGAVEVTGQGATGASSSGNDGVFVGQSSAMITSNGGNVKVTGTGGGTGTSSSNVGVQIGTDGKITAGGSGTVDVIGQGGPNVNSSTNYGVALTNPGAQITSNGGAVTVNGTGGGAGGGAGTGSNYGVYCADSTTITSGGTANVTIIGQGGNFGSDGNYGVKLVSAASVSAGGSLTITGFEGAIGTTPYGFYDDNASVTCGASGNITLIANTMFINSSSTITTANLVTVRQRTNGIAIDLGGSDIFVTTLGLSDPELDCITAGTLQIGDINSGTVTLSSAISHTGSTKLAVTTGGAINLNADLDNGSGDITLTATGAITQNAGKITTTGTFTASSGQKVSLLDNGNSSGQTVVPTNSTTIVNGTMTGAIQVNGTLGGSGTVGTVTVTGTGTIAPGNSPGKLTTGNIVFNSGSVLSMELNGPNAGADYDQLSVNGTVNLGGATLSATLGYSPAANQVFKIIDNDGGDAVTGTFNGYIEGATVTIGGVNFTISYQGGDGNDVTLTRQPSVAAPTVTSVVLDEGTGGTIGGVSGTQQRSEVRRVIVTFSEAVNFSPTVVSAFTLARSGASSSAGTAGNVALTTNPVAGPASSVTITFSGTYADSTGSLVDGIYNFSIDATKVTGAGGQLNGSGGGAGTNYTVTGTTANKWFRYYGDQNADGTVDQTDYLVFRNALAGGPNSVFDYQNSSDVDQTDYLEFRNRLAGAP